MEPGYYFHVPPEAKEAGLANTDFIGPFPTREAEQQAKRKLIDTARRKLCCGDCDECEYPCADLGKYERGDYYGRR